MDHDDVQVGRVLSRREAVALLGAAGASIVGGRILAGDASEASGAVLPSGAPLSSGALSSSGAPLSGAAFPSCIVRPEQTEGPYFVEEVLARSDIRPDPLTGVSSDGVRLDLEFRVSRVGAGACEPLEGAVVDVWQCDALGVYSDVRDFQGLFDTRGEKFLRGHQVTDADGSARFTTIYPGWYEGRTVHIHFKVRTEPGADRGHEFTSQLYFDDALTDDVMKRAPYAEKGPRPVRNAQDGIYRRGGDQLTLRVLARGGGYAGTFDLGLQVG